ncbi:hypothetical protein [Lacipirellula limnantheis]|uniref:Uncharacterized protein n=1 Tax=Lacipirellula limnantheis TaxID=2528024 RepID=A0A517U3C2_9BACT|nr:hypothetical protein [Lacipirellula limnantheis]QDT75124.1 hypothetical protein I41_43330 [Lacipirellula limnantheis]
MRLSIRFWLLVVVPYVAGLAIIWRLAEYTGRSAWERDIYWLFRVLFLAWFTIGWTFVGWMLTLFWSRKRRR